MEKLFKYFKRGTILYVILHGQWRQSRGRNPSATFSGERNPKKALRLAIEALHSSEPGNIFCMTKSPGDAVMESIIRRLGFYVTVDSKMRADCELCMEYLPDLVIDPMSGNILRTLL